MLIYLLVFSVIVSTSFSILGVTVRGKRSGVAKEDSEFYLKDEDDAQPRARFVIHNEWVEPNTFQEIYALIDCVAKSELTLPQTLADHLKLVPTGAVGKSAMKTLYKPVKLVAIFYRNGIREERSEYLSVGVFLESTDMEESKSQLQAVQDDTSKRARRESGGSISAKEGVIDLIPICAVVEHHPPSKPGQRVILGAIALHKLCFHVNVAERCLEIEEERVERVG